METRNAVRQLLNALLPTVRRSEVQVALDTAQTNDLALLEKESTQRIERVLITVIASLLSDFQVSIKCSETSQAHC